MKIFITGVTGFVGSHLVREFVRRGHEVSGLSHQSNILGYLHPDILQWLRGARIYYGDVNNFSSINDIIKDVRPDIIVHLAAHTAVEYSFHRVHEALETNFIGTANLAEAARLSVPDLKKFIFASSVEVYGNQKKYPVNEETPTSAASPYGVAKVAAEQYLQFLHRAYGFPCIIFRNTNSYGRTHDDYFVIEHTIVQMLQRRDKIKMGDPRPVRDFIYIEDEINAYLVAIETNKDITGEIFIPGTGEVISIGDLVEKIKLMTGYEGEIEWHSISYRPCEIWRIDVDPSKIKRVLGWESKYSLDEGLERTIRWWRNKIKEKTLDIDMGKIPKGVSED